MFYVYWSKVFGGGHYILLSWFLSKILVQPKNYIDWGKLKMYCIQYGRLPSGSLEQLGVDCKPERAVFFSELIWWVETGVECIMDLSGDMYISYIYIYIHIYIYTCIHYLLSPRDIMISNNISRWCPFSVLFGLELHVPWAQLLILGSWLDHSNDSPENNEVSHGFTMFL